jgi:hypothetical protein
MAIYFDQNGNLVDTEISESSNVFMEDPTENFYQPRMDISATQDFYQPQMDVSATQDFYQPNNLSPTQDFYPLDRNPTQMFYPPRQFVNAPQGYYPPDLTSTKGLPNLDLQSLPANMGVANEEDVEQEFLPGQKKESGIMKLINFLAPGNLIGNLLPKQDPRATGIRNFYSPEGLTSTGQIASGIMKGYNPVSGGFLNMISRGKFGNPTNYGLAGAMQRRIEKIAGRKAPQTEASRAKIAELRNLQDLEMRDRYDRGESLGSIGRSTFSGPGMAFAKQSGGVSKKGTADERNYGGR